MSRLFVDTNILLYAVGAPHRHKKPCLGVLQAASSGRVHLHASVELIQEFLFHRLRRMQRAEAIEQARDVRRLVTLHPFDEAVTDKMIELTASHEIGGRDAVHVATSLLAGFDHVVTADSGLGTMSGIRVIPPSEALP